MSKPDTDLAESCLNMCFGRMLAGANCVVHAFLMVSAEFVLSYSLI